MVVGKNESMATKNADKSMTILIAMAMQRYNAGRIHPGLHSKPLNAPNSRVPALYPPAATMVNNFGQKHKTLMKNYF